MEEISTKFAFWFQSLSKSEKVENIKKFSINLNRLYKSMEKATKSEMQYGFNRVGMRGGKFTSLNAKADNCARMYQQCESELKYMIKFL